MALTQDRNTTERTGAAVSRPVAAGAKLFAGGMGAINAAGNIVPASNTAGLKVIGRIESAVDNTAGVAGDQSVTLKRGVFHYANSAASALTFADIGTNALVEDDGIVAKAAINNVVAGKIIDIDAQGVWVEIR